MTFDPVAGLAREAAQRLGPGSAARAETAAKLVWTAFEALRDQGATPTRDDVLRRVASDDPVAVDAVADALFKKER